MVLGRGGPTPGPMGQTERHRSEPGQIPCRAKDSRRLVCAIELTRPFKPGLSCPLGVRVLNGEARYLSEAKAPEDIGQAAREAHRKAGAREQKCADALRARLSHVRQANGKLRRTHLSSSHNSLTEKLMPA